MAAGQNGGAMSDATYGATTHGAGTSREVVSAVFNDSGDAPWAGDWLRDNGVAESAISVASRAGDDVNTRDDVSDAYDDEAADDAADAGKRALTGAGIGAGVGALFGLAAAAIPGV